MSTRAMSVASVIASHFPSLRMRRESRFASCAGEDTGTAPGSVVGSMEGSAARSAAGWRVIQRITMPATRKRNQEPPFSDRLTRERRIAPATARKPRPITGHGRSRRLRRAAVAIESSLPSSGMTSAAAA